MVKTDVAPFKNIGASNHSRQERANEDYYITDPLAIRMLHKYDLLDKNVKYWENACGNGSLSKELIKLGYDVYSSDKYDRGYGDVGIDFFEYNDIFQGNLITNPPYNVINDWIPHSIDVASNKVYIFCRIQTIETRVRYDKIFKNSPPVLICPFVKRIKCHKSTDASPNRSAICYAWFIWDNKDDSNETKVKWLV